MDLKEILQQLENLNEFFEKQSLNEMAQIGNDFYVHKEDDIKFAHFHWNGNKNIHFKFLKDIPRNALQAREMIAFPKEQKLIEDWQLTKIVNKLKKPITYNKIKFNTIYEGLQATWKLLNNKEIDYV